MYFQRTLHLRTMLFNSNAFNVGSCSMFADLNLPLKIGVKSLTDHPTSRAFSCGTYAMYLFYQSKKAIKEALLAGCRPLTKKQ